MKFYVVHDILLFGKVFSVIPSTTGPDCRLNDATVLQAGMNTQRCFSFSCVYLFDVCTGIILVLISTAHL